ncbi:MAG: hypothetical protein KDK39_20245, partial [Leptospiraceae bacterium]|nr:hypothetical protein [Leptospiraceae bacterium]
MLNLKNARILFVAGLLLMTLSLFFENLSVARYFSVTGQLSELDQERKLEFAVDQPDRPVNEALLLKRPDRPGYNASESDKLAYEVELADYEKERDSLLANYKEQMTDYT